MKKNVLIATGALVLAFAVTGCATTQPTADVQPDAHTADKSGVVVTSTLPPVEQAEVDTATEEGQSVNRAMYIPLGNGSHIMVDQEYGSVYVVQMPEEIYDLDGNLISADELQKGNIVEIYGNGIMAMSYPGQYPGVTKIQVVEEGQPSDADAYQEIIDQVYVEPDPSEPPSLQAKYHIPSANVMASISRGGTTWSFVDEDGQTQTVTEDCPHVLQWEEMNALKISEPTEVELKFYPEQPTEVSVQRWSSDDLGTESESILEEGESVEVVNKDGSFFVTAEPGFVYSVTATWEQGTVEYGFLSNAAE